MRDAQSEVEAVIADKGKTYTSSNDQGGRRFEENKWSPDSDILKCWSNATLNILFQHLRQTSGSNVQKVGLQIQQEKAYQDGC